MQDVMSTIYNGKDRNNEDKARAKDPNNKQMHIKPSSYDGRGGVHNIQKQKHLYDNGISSMTDTGSNVIKMDTTMIYDSYVPESSMRGPTGRRARVLFSHSSGGL